MHYGSFFCFTHCLGWIAPSPIRGVVNNDQGADEGVGRTTNVTGGRAFTVFTRQADPIVQGRQMLELMVDPLRE
jgi:hypothetical protein